MKLYAKISAGRGGREAVKGDNDVITISLFSGNLMQGILTLNSYNNELVYSTLQSNEFIPVYREKLKGKTQKGEHCLDCGITLQTEEEHHDKRCLQCEAIHDKDYNK